MTTPTDLPTKLADEVKMQARNWDATRHFFAYQMIVCRLRSNQSLEDVAMKIGVSISTMKAFENGNIGRMTLLHIAKLATLFGTAPLVRFTPFPVPISYDEEAANDHTN